MKITEALIAEHQVFHSLFDHIENTAPKLKTLGEVKVLSGLLEAALKAHALTEDELRKFLSEKLTGYKRPRYIEFRKELPKTNVGKILRRALRDEIKAA